MGMDDTPERIADIVANLGEKLSKADAAAVSLLARSLAPNDPWIRSITSKALSASVPNWHWAIARDTRRNDAYDQALRACITPESTVLEVGTGSGILAMMAARAGARHVYTVEIVPLIAEAARENIRRNGFEDSITVICADLMEVTVGGLLPERCNVFLHEIVSNDLLGENVLALTEHARSALLAEDALHMPDSIWAMCQLGHADPSEHGQPLGTQASFDLSAIDLLHTPNTLRQGPISGFEPLGDPVEVLRFDLTGQAAHPPEDATLETAVTGAGQANAIVQWIGFSFPDGTEFTNPPDVSSCWALRVLPIDDRTVAKGDTFNLRRRYDHSRLLPMAVD